MKNCEENIKHISTCEECGRYISSTSNAYSPKHKENVSKISCIRADLCFDIDTGVKK